MTALLIMLSIGLEPPGPEVYHCDVIELNHYRLALTQEVYYSQLIFWVWHAGEFEVIHWTGTAKYTGYQRINNGQVKIRLENRIIIAPEFRERWTNYDPETRDRRRVSNRFRWLSEKGKKPWG